MAGSLDTQINPWEVSIKIRTSGALKSGFKGLTFSRYQLMPLPSNTDSDFRGELLLNFKGDRIPSHLVGEGKIISAWLSVLLKQKIIVDASRLNNINISKTKTENISFETECTFPENIEELYNKFKSLPLAEKDSLLEKYSRACKVYQEAIILSNVYPTLSFFLLVTAIECVSTPDREFYAYLLKEMGSREDITKEEVDTIYCEYNTKYGIKNSFIEFILKNYDEWKDEFSEEEFRDLLGTAYKIRSNFTHKGKNIEEYIRVIDTIIRGKTVSRKVGNKKVEVLGLNYFSEIVRKVLIKFLDGQPDLGCDNIPELALQDITMELVATTDIKGGEVVTADKIKYRK